MTVYSRFAKLAGEISLSEMVAITSHLQAEEISMAGVAPYGPDHASSEEPMDEIIAQFLRLLMNLGVRNLTEPLRSSFKSLGVIDVERNNRKPISDSGWAQLFLPGRHSSRLRLPLFGTKEWKPSSVRWTCLLQQSLKIFPGNSQHLHHSVCQFFSILEVDDWHCVIEQYRVSQIIPPWLHTYIFKCARYHQWLKPASMAWMRILSRRALSGPPSIKNLWPRCGVSPQVAIQGRRCRNGTNCAPNVRRLSRSRVTSQSSNMDRAFMRKWYNYRRRRNWNNWKTNFMKEKRMNVRCRSRWSSCLRGIL